MFFKFISFSRSKSIELTRPLIPDLKRFKRTSKDIFKSRMLTNRSFYVRKLEERIKNYSNLNSLVLTSNGTSAMEAILKNSSRSLKSEKNEIIVPAFTFVATVSAIISAGYKPVFVDVKLNNGTIDPEKISELITKNTYAIVGVHIYGNPCDHKKIKAIANQNNLKLFYDASHAFAVTKDGISILNYGDASSISFHATKVFTTCEGGGVITDDEKLVSRIRKYINHGISDLYQIELIGSNNKMSELHAAYGLSVIDQLSKAIASRKKIYTKYIEFLSKLDYQILPLLDQDNCNHNYIYAPFLFESEILRDGVHDYLRQKKILVKKYFYPLLTDVPALKKYKTKTQDLKISKELSKKVLCFPLYDSMNNSTLKKIFDETYYYLKSIA